MNKPIYKQIYKYIKKYDTIVIGRHIGADPDCLAAQLGLRDSLRLKFPDKKILAVGAPASRFKFLGHLDHVADTFDYSNALAIVVDTPDKKRIDDIDVSKCAFSIKIDHHPYLETTCEFEFIDDSASSSAQLIIEFILDLGLPLTEAIGETLYAGLISDTNRFMFSTTSAKTFELVMKLMTAVPIDLEKVYRHLYTRPLHELRFLGYIKQNIIVTEDGLAYMKLDNKTMEEFKVDPATAGNMVNDLNYIHDYTVWVLFSEQSKEDNIRVVLRSRGPVINDVLAKYNGGGHLYAAGARLKTWNDVDDVIGLLNERCKEYKENQE